MRKGIAEMRKNMNYQIFTDATSDLDEALLSGLPHIEIIPMDIEIDGELFTYAVRRETADFPGRFCAWLSHRLYCIQR